MLFPRISEVLKLKTFNNIDLFLIGRNWSSPGFKSNNIDKKGKDSGGTFHCFNFPLQPAHFLTWLIWVVCSGFNCCCKNYDHQGLQEFCTRSLGSLEQWSSQRSAWPSVSALSLSLQLGSSYYLLSMSFFVRLEKRKNNIFSFLSFITWQTSCSVVGGGSSDIVNNVLSEFLWRPTL